MYMCVLAGCLEDAEPNLFQQGRGLVTPGAWAHLQVLLPLSDPCLRFMALTLWSLSAGMLGLGLNRDPWLESMYP